MVQRVLRAHAATRAQVLVSKVLRATRAQQVLRAHAVALVTKVFKVLRVT